MRLIDVVFRGGHLSEQKLIEAVMSGERPSHVERCDICAERAVELGRWLDQVRATGNEAVDAAFPPERLMAQQQQILRRLEQLDQPARVISFPNQSRLSRDMGGRRVAIGWLGVAAAAGILLGVVSSQATERLTRRPTAPPVAAQQSQPATQDQDTADPATTNMASRINRQEPQLFEEIDRPIPSAFEAMASMTPRIMNTTPVTLRTPSKK